MADHVKVLREWLRQVQGRLDYHASRSPHGPNPSTVAERDALTAAISAMTVDEAMVERACAAFYADKSWRTNTNYSRDFMRAALTAAIHGESHD